MLILLLIYFETYGLELFISFSNQKLHENEYSSSSLNETIQCHHFFGIYKYSPLLIIYSLGCDEYYLGYL